MARQPSASKQPGPLSGSTQSSLVSALSDSADPIKLSPEETPVDIAAYRQSKDGLALAAWVKSEYEKAKNQRRPKMMQWYRSMAFFYGNQWVELSGGLNPAGFDSKLMNPKKPYYKNQKVINKVRLFVRQELAAFTSQMPTASVVPATNTDEDVRAAFAGEQVWSYLQDTQHLPRHLRNALLWMTLTGNGFMKQWWDSGAGEDGNICYGTVTPFHLFVPDLREVEIEDQPFIINAYVKPVGWIQQFFAQELQGVQLNPSTTSANQIVESSYLNLSGTREPDSCVLYEAWIKPGAHKLLPNGGLVLMVDDTLISVAPDGMPYQHQQYPFTHLTHIPSGTFYADSPLVDLIGLQKEYNEIRSEIADAGRRMARPQLVVQKGSIVPGKMTNEPGLIIEYRPGTPAPTPLQLSPLPDYYVSQQDRVENDWNEITGNIDALLGDVPNGITAGTAINYLQEKANNFLKTEYASIEEGVEKVAIQSLSLFNQYVDMPRKIRTIGADASFDTMLLSGMDIAAGMDIRIDKDSSLPQSQAAKAAQVTQWYELGLIDGESALKLMEVGNIQKVLDVVNVAQRKAQRENWRMKVLTPEQIDQFNQQWPLAIAQQPPRLNAQQQLVGDPINGDPTALIFQPLGTAPNGLTPQPNPMVPVDSFDIHQIHLVEHNAFRMSQQYETLPPEVKLQFDVHCQLHEQMQQRGALMQFLQKIPSDGTDAGGPQQMGGSAPAPGESPTGAAGPGASQETGADSSPTLAGNGQAPSQTQEGE